MSRWKYWRAMAKLKWGNPFHFYDGKNGSHGKNRFYAAPRIKAIQELQEIGTPAAVAAVIEVAKEDRSEMVREAAIQSLLDRKHPEAVSLLSRWLQSRYTPDRMLRTFEQFSLDGKQLVNLLEDPAAYPLRSAIMTKLAECGDSVPTQPLIRLFLSQHTPSAVRSLVARVLARHDDPRIADSLLPTLQDRSFDPAVRLEIARTLVRLKDSRVLLALLSLLSQQNETILLGTIVCLGDLGDTRAIAALTGQFLSGKTLRVSPAIKEAILESLGRLGWKPQSDAERATVAAWEADQSEREVRELLSRLNSPAVSPAEKVQIERILDEKGVTEGRLFCSSCGASPWKWRVGNLNNHPWCPSCGGPM